MHIYQLFIRFLFPSFPGDEFLNQIISASATELATSLFSLGVLGADKILATDVLQELLNEPVEGGGITDFRYLPNGLSLVQQFLS